MKSVFCPFSDSLFSTQAARKSLTVRALNVCVSDRLAVIFVVPSSLANPERDTLGEIDLGGFTPTTAVPSVLAGPSGGGWTRNTIGSPAGPDTASWSSGVATLGGGFVWKLRGNLYLNPWAAGHLLLSRPEVTLYGATWKPGALTGEVSLKVGWYTSL